ncbi:MAG: zinc-binding dehydrogenase [Caldilineaceae bacterium]
MCVDAHRGPQAAILDMVQAAAIPLTALTAWEGIFDLQRRRARRQALAAHHWRAGGVGSIAIQLAKRVGNFHVIATASRPESAVRCRELGADAVIDHARPLAPQLHEAGYEGVDFIFSTATLDNFAQMAEALKPLGHICVIQGGPSAQSVNVAPLMPKRGTLSFELMFTRPSTGAEPERQGAILNRVAQLLDDVLATTLTTVLPGATPRTRTGASRPSIPWQNRAARRELSRPPSNSGTMLSHRWTQMNTDTKKHRSTSVLICAQNPRLIQTNFPICVHLWLAGS